MATWEDGPEYAPLERPAEFVTPAAAPLSVAEAPTPAPELPAAEPHFEAPAQPGPELAALVTDTGLDRNPRLAFDVAVAALTADGIRAERSPLEPFGPPGPSLSGYLPVENRVDREAQLNPSPMPMPAPQWAPPPAPPAAPAPQAVSLPQILAAATPGVLIALAVGAVFSWLSLFMFALAFSLSARIGYRRAVVRRAFGVAVAAIGVSGVATMASNGFYADVLLDGLVSGAQLACWVLPVVVVVIVASALRAGERPEADL